ncbi:hypothetical protein DEU56DRAFT_750833 [Suillus clintonianus]|uniref:uncharacterized protein n=1 Tax=Suillus clintonianus TaxID=1904413 RepID=UPI001B87C3EC|nr:uncharacterized protein DEU56DRAFT_750833 [Suillus clintonianus]KAG2156284.1 hypothetical protein DEU56DRAFT_750833 [Suillus clintonianus]
MYVINYSPIPLHQMPVLQSNATPRVGRRKPVISPTTYFAHRQQKPSPTTRSQRPTFFHYLRKFISSSRTNAAPPVLRDPLDFPATSPLPRNILPLAQGSSGHALPPIVDVPLAQGKERNASADAPAKNSGEWIADEDYVPSRPPSTNPDSQPPAVQVNTGEHGNEYPSDYFPFLYQ